MGWLFACLFYFCLPMNSAWIAWMVHFNCLEKTCKKCLIKNFIPSIYIWWFFFIQSPVQNNRCIQPACFRFAYVHFPLIIVQEWWPLARRWLDNPSLELMWMHQLFCMEELMKKNHQMWIPGMTVYYCISFLSAVAQCTFPQARSIMLSRQFILCLQAIHLWNQATWLSVKLFFWNSPSLIWPCPPCVFPKLKWW